MASMRAAFSTVGQTVRALASSIMEITMLEDGKEKMCLHVERWKHV